MRAWLALVVTLAGACGPTLVWHGKSPDRGRELRLLEHRGQFVVLDGQRGSTYDGIAIGALTFSPDSRHLAYAARRGRHWRVVADGRDGPRFDGIGEVTYGPDSRRLAYTAEVGGEWQVIVDGRRGPGFDALLAGSLTFSPDGRRVAYVGIRAGGHHVVVDGAAGPSWSGVGRLVFSADSRHVAYLARRGPFAHAVLDGVAGPDFEAIDDLAISPRRGRLAYLARRADRWHAVVDGVAGPGWDLARGLAFSADGDHVAYTARREQGDSFVVLDGVVGPSHLGVRPATLAFVGGATRPTYVAQRDFRFFVVHDGVEGPAFDDVRSPVASADGSRWGYVGRLGRGWRPVIDGVERRAEPWASDPVFSPRGDRVAYLARRGPDVAAIVDGVEHRFDVVLDGTLAFEPDGRAWGCVVGVRAERRFYFVVDGVRRGRFDVEEAIDDAMRTGAGGGRRDGIDRLLADWVAAEIARALR